MKAQIYCKNSQYGKHDFFLSTGNQEYFLFRQKYHKSVQQHFRNGLRIEEVFDYSKTRRVDPVVHTLSKLPAYIKYVENEYGITVLQQTQKKQNSFREANKIPA